MASLTPDLPAVAEHVERLERELRAERRRNRWLRATVALATVAAIQAGIWPNTTATAQTQGPKGIRANQFVLDDEQGRPRVWLFVDKNGPRMTILSENGRAIWSAP